MKIPALGFQYEPCEKGGLPLLLAELERIREQTPILLHGFGPQSYNLGARDFIERFDRSVAEQVILASGTRELSGHLGPDMKKAGEYREWKEARQTCVENIRFIRETFPRMPHVAVENMDGNPYAVWSQLGCFLEPDFIREVVEDSGS